MSSKSRSDSNRYTVTTVKDDWYVLCLSQQLQKKPVSATLMDTPLVIFRDASGVAHTLLDRCPHRNVPLSLGTVKGKCLECCYHGWQFDGAGQCTHVPGLVQQKEKKGRNVPAYPTREQQGMVWVYGTPDCEPERDPFKFPYLDDKRFTSVYDQFEANATLHATAENALDVPHTAFLHGGLFRTADGPKNNIEVVVKRWHDRVEAEFIGEPRPAGLIGKVLAPGGGSVEHFDRFFLPCITQVEYKLGKKIHFCTNAALTPVSDFKTKLFTVVSYLLPVPGALAKPFLRPFALKVFKQDAWMLKAQTDLVQHFGGEQFVSTEIDVVGPQIARLLKQAERGERSPVDEPSVRTLTMQT